MKIILLKYFYRGIRVVDILLLSQIMSEYKGFITQTKYIELMNILGQIAEMKGLENKLHHLYQPDTDMNDKICENLTVMKNLIMLDIHRIMHKCIELGDKILLIKEEN